MHLGQILSGLFCLAFAAGQQRIAPGVPPQQYAQPQHVVQQPVHQQVVHQQVPVQQQVPIQNVQYQQVPVQQVQQQQIPVQQVQQQQIPVQQVQQQQIPVQQVQQQQIPIQQVQQQIPVQQVPVQQVPVQHHHPQQQQILNAANIAHEKEHIQEHLEVPIDTSKMSEQELQFHYFKMHDADNNNKLDGCELIKSLIHWHEPDENGTRKEARLFDNDDQLADIIDPILKEADRNNDGYIDYYEFKLQDNENV